MTIVPASIAADPATLPQRLGEKGFTQLARLGSVALKAAGIKDSLVAVSQTGMTPEVAKEILSALEPIANGVAPGTLTADDAKAVVAAFAKGEISHISFDPKQFDGFGKELLAMIGSGQAASATLAFKNFCGVEQTGGVKWAEGGISYWGMNAVSSLTSKIRGALMQAGVDPNKAGIPQPGPQAM